MSKSCTLHDVLYVPELSYNLVSVAKLSQKGKIVKFTSNACYILDKRHKMIVKAAKMEKLYRRKCKTFHEHASIVTISKEDVWYKQFKHLGVGSLQILSHDRVLTIIHHSNLPFVRLVLKGSTTLHQVSLGYLETAFRLSPQ